ncbi:uncharacterized protein LOC119889437 [Micropterus salmoides]|uniref:uncharacterized protein LOC119889437 n=1 Tax=Micropterus salmoides TaxID=27706 RepID=UPI0018ECD316|nr:uncharacterized protein LOC119889437 [Micropterus salmoides]
MYHCEIAEWTANPEWSGTYLLLKGKTQRTTNYTVIQGQTISDPDCPGDSMTLQCSVLSESENMTCPGDHSVYWFRAGSDKSHPDIIYTDGNGHDECDKRSDSQKSCVYHFSKNISSSDAGTYYCAVAACGEILFGDGTKVDSQAAVILEQNSGYQKTQQRDEETWIYSAVVFGMMKADGAIKDAKAAERQGIYAAVKAFGLD